MQKEQAMADESSNDYENSNNPPSAQEEGASAPTPQVVAGIETPADATATNLAAADAAAVEPTRKLDRGEAGEPMAETPASASPEPENVVETENDRHPLDDQSEVGSGPSEGFRHDATTQAPQQKDVAKPSVSPADTDSVEQQNLTAIVPRAQDGSKGDVAIVESASATTSPDNANSGYLAYVITVLVLVGVLFLSMGLWSCTSSLVESGIRTGLGNLAEQWGQDDDSEALPYGSGGNGSGSRGSASGSSLSAKDALDLDLDLYSDTIGSTISASDYAGTPNSMRSYVLSLVHTDGDHNSAVVADLNAAAAADDPRGDIESALSECDSAIADINATEVPSDLGSEATSSAQSGKDKAVARWQAIQEELKLFDTQDEVSYSDLQKADTAVAEATADAGTELVQALTLAAESH